MSKISVIITSYNQKVLLKEAIDSVLSQSYLPFEIIVCDDFSKDGSRDLIRSYELNYPNLVKGIFQKMNLGISKNRNSGLNSVQGDFVTWLDGDDLFRWKKLEYELDHFKSINDIKWVYSQVIELDTANCKIRFRYGKPLKGLIFNKVVSALGRAPRNPLVNFNALKKIGFFDEHMEMYEDFDLCLRLAKHYKCSYCREPLMEYRIHSSGIHNTPSNKHIINLDYLYNNFKELIKDVPKDNRHRLEHSFLDQKNFILLLKDVEEGNGFSASNRLIKWLCFNPLRILKIQTFAKLLIKYFKS